MAGQTLAPVPRDKQGGEHVGDGRQPLGDPGRQGRDARQEITVGS